MKIKLNHPMGITAIIILIITVTASVILAHSLYEKKKEIDAYKPLVPFIKLAEDDSFEETIDKIRVFVNSYSMHSIDEEFYSHWGKHDIIVDKFLAYIKGESNEPVHLECSSRAAAMKKILQGLGYRTRSVDVYRFEDNYGAHTFLEVQNPQTKTWHVQDPGYNIFWIKNSTKERASITDLIELGEQKVSPCDKPNNCGWHITPAGGQSPVKRLPAHLGLAVTIDRTKNERVLYHNKTIFDIDSPKKVNKSDIMMTYCEYREKNCRDKIVDLSPR